MLTSLDVHDALRRGVDDNVGEEIDLVDIENVPIRGGEQPGPERDAAALGAPRSSSRMPGPDPHDSNSAPSMLT
jgi:hypothetical protein